MYDTIWPADTVEFCPHPNASNIVVCGTYKLDDEVTTGPFQQRRGQCLILRVENGQVEKIDEIVGLPAVLDTKWCHGTDPPVLAVAESEGNVSLFEWDIEKHRMLPLSSLKCSNVSSSLCLSLDWSNRRSQSSLGIGSLAVSLSDGKICIARPSEGAVLEIDNSWHAHDYEPWVVAWNYWDTNIVYSGGDDLMLKAWDIREDCDRPAWVWLNKTFTAGITSIQSHPFCEHILAVGSYDSHVRIFDVRSHFRPISEVDVGGGAWRVKWHPSPERQNDLLVAAMHGGCRIVRWDNFGHDSTSDIIKQFTEHSSMAYGADWAFSAEYDTTITSCSFYDHALHVWSG